MQPIVDTAEVAPPRQLSTRRSSGNPFLLRDNGLELRLASSRSERIEAQRLRFEVFNLELQLGLTSSLASGLDQDAHDGHCDHLLVVDTDRDCLVGTYRLLSFDRVPSFGFYSESEFDLTNVKRSGLRLLELGRSCVALEYRDGRVISLLFRGIAEYLRRTDADALMGCASIHGTDLPELAAIQAMLSQRFLSGPEPAGHPPPGVRRPAAAAEYAGRRNVRLPLPSSRCSGDTSAWARRYAGRPRTTASSGRRTTSSSRRRATSSARYRRRFLG